MLSACILYDVKCGKKMNSFPQEQQMMAWAGNVCEAFKLGLAHLQRTCGPHS